VQLHGKNYYNLQEVLLMNIFTNYIYPALAVITTAIGAYALKEIKTFFTEKRIRAVANEIYMKIKEDSRLGDFMGDKIKAFEDALMARFPKISTEDMNLLNKAIAGKINDGKLAVLDEVKEVSEIPEVKEAVIGVVTTVEKYYNTDGDELFKAVPPIV